MIRYIKGGHWEYTLKSGKALRDAIYSEDAYKILEILQKAYSELFALFPDCYDEYEMEEIRSDIDSVFDDIENYSEYDMTYDDVVDNIDWLLNRFYDDCDDLNVWVEI